MRKTKPISGFTLLEMCLVIVIGGLITAAVAQQYRVYLVGQKVRDLNTSLQFVHSAILNFPAQPSGPGTETTQAPPNARLPCPAGPMLPPTDLNYGMESRDEGTGTCTLNGGVVRVATARGNVLIGAVPYIRLAGGMAWKGSTRTTNYSLAASLPTSGPYVDPWGRQFIYAVTEEMTQASQTHDPVHGYGNQIYGAVAVTTEYAAGTINGTSLVTPEGAAGFVVFSAGENGSGAYTREGNLVAPCPAGTPGTDVTMDSANCQNTGRFIAGLRHMNDGQNSYFDDALLFSPPQMGRGLWTSRDIGTRIWELGKDYIRDGVCREIGKGGTANLSCPAGETIARIIFASYGTPSGRCGGYVADTGCHAARSMDVVRAACLGQNACSVGVNNGTFADASFTGDPCPGTPKMMMVDVLCSGALQDKPTSLVFVEPAPGAKAYYEARVTHTSSEDDKPGTGADWEEYWKLLTRDPPQQKTFNTHSRIDPGAGRIGVGTETPASALDIVNTVGSPSAALQAETLLTSSLCDAQGENCISPSLLGGTALLCPAGQVMTGIVNGAVQCAVYAAPAAVTGGCFNNELAYGIDPFGHFLCQCPYSDQCAKCGGSANPNNTCKTCGSSAVEHDLDFLCP